MKKNKIRWKIIMFFLIFLINTLYLINNVIILTTSLITLTTLGSILLLSSVLSIILTGDYLIYEYNDLIIKIKNYIIYKFFKKN